MQLFKGGIRVGRIVNVAIFIDYSWFIFFALVVWTFGRIYFPHEEGFAPSTSWVLATIASLLLFASVLFHELSHAVVSNRLGFPIRKITLFIFGGVAHMQSEPDNARTELYVALAGPLSSLALWLGFRFAAGFLDAAGARELISVAVLLAQLNLVLAIFNLVPGFPLDGGRVMRALIWWRSGSLKRATRFAARGGELFSYFLMAAGVIMMFRDGWITGIWYILIGIFLRSGAEESYRHVLVEEVLAGIFVREIMGSNPLAVRDSDSVANLEEIFLQRKFTLYPVIDSGEVVVGLIDVGDVREVAPDARERTPVREVMHRVPRPHLPLASSTAVEALRSMMALGVSRLPVVDAEGRIEGIISRSDIMSMFEIREELGDDLIV